MVMTKSEALRVLEIDPGRYEEVMKFKKSRTFYARFVIISITIDDWFMLETARKHYHAHISRSVFQLRWQWIAKIKFELALVRNCRLFLERNVFYSEIILLWSICYKVLNSSVPGVFLWQIVAGIFFARVNDFQQPPEIMTTGK